jgi:hypothetical protein
MPPSKCKWLGGPEKRDSLMCPLTSFESHDKSAMASSRCFRLLGRPLHRPEDSVRENSLVASVLPN